MEYSCSRYSYIKLFWAIYVYLSALSNPENNFVRVKNETVAYDTRKWRILEQIVIRQPDLCALEEVDTYDCFLQYHLPKYGYSKSLFTI